MSLSDLGLGPAPWIVGHRGVAGEAPENSLDSLLLALDQGADMVELDLQLTADGELVACHDWTLERMGGVAARVEETAFSELADVEISGPFRRAGERRVLATLSDVLTVLPRHVPLNLELKRRRAEPEALVRKLGADLGARRAVLISSFDWELLARVAVELPGRALAPLGGRRADPAELLAVAAELDAASVHCRDSLVDAGLLAAAGDQGRPLLVYTVNEVDTARRLFEAGVAGVFSDFPGRLRRALDETEVSEQ